MVVGKHVNSTRTRPDPIVLLYLIVCPMRIFMLSDAASCRTDVGMNQLVVLLTDNSGLPCLYRELSGLAI